jgi:hypothetical protein
MARASLAIGLVLRRIEERLCRSAQHWQTADESLDADQYPCKHELNVILGVIRMYIWFLAERREGSVRASHPPPGNNSSFPPPSKSRSLQTPSVLSRYANGLNSCVSGVSAGIPSGETSKRPAPGGVIP